MIQIIKTIKVVADYDIVKQFDSVEDLMEQLKNYGYEGEYDEENQEFIDALNELYDEPMYVGGTLGREHRIDNIEINTENFETYYTF